MTVPDLRPNIGLFWYFFTEMFEHFRVLFLCAFQMNASILYLGPLAFRLHAEPMLLATSLTTLIAIFKSYPSLGDVGFYLALLPMWKHLFHCEYFSFAFCFLEIIPINFSNILYKHCSLIKHSQYNCDFLFNHTRSA